MLRAPLAALVIVLGALALAGSAGADPRFDPSFGVSLTQAAPQAPSELTLSFRIERGYQLATAVVYLPLDWGVARGEEIPVGTKVAVVDAIETYGFINQACNQAIAIRFELLNASLDSSQTVSFSDTEWEQGLDPSTSGFGIQDFTDDRDGNGLLDAIDHYPDFLNTTFGEVRPITRIAGVAVVAGVPVLLQFLIFAPGTRLDLPDSALSQAIADSPESGYLTVMVVQDFRNPDYSRQPWPITDYCTPRDTSLSFVPPESGPALLVNPQDGAYAFTLVASSKRDADGDGYENSMDTCPTQADVGNPTMLASGDDDQDGIDAACDPNDDPIDLGLNSDEDGDGYINRQDNCPLMVNGSREMLPPGNQFDLDFDDIGDACDPSPQSPDGETIVSIKTVDVIVGDPSGSGGPPSVDACPHCYQPGTGPADAEAQDEGSGGQLAVAIGLIALGTGAGVVVVGSGALYLIRRRRS